MQTRFVRKEMTLLRWLFAFLSELFYFKDDMQPRLEMIQDGSQRIDKLIEDVSSLLKEIIATGTQTQKDQLTRALQDYKVELVPKCTPTSTKVVLSPETAKNLVDFAQERCKACVEDNVSCRQCNLYKLLEGVVTPDSYDTLLCPYAIIEWAKEGGGA